MKIATVEAIPYEIGMRKPLLFASGQMTKADHVLVRITTDDGLVGIADVPPRPYTYGETQRSVVAVIETLFAPLLVGADPFARSVLGAGMARTVGNFAAKGAVDIALWDIIGKSVGKSVHQLLGGFTPSVRVSHMVGFAPAQEMVDEALMYREKYGINSFKVKVGRRPVSLDVDACIALREALGAEVQVRVRDGAEHLVQGHVAQHKRPACGQVRLAAERESGVKEVGLGLDAKHEEHGRQAREPRQQPRRGGRGAVLERVKK